MEPVLAPDLYVFATCVAQDMPSGLVPRMMFQEAEGTTLIVLKSEAEAAGLKWDFPCRMITLNIHSALDAVGFLARITTHLARLGMSVNPVSAFYHDHIFVPEDRAKDALSALHDLSHSVP